MYTLTPQFKLSDQDYTMFNSNIDDPDVSLVIEYLLIVRKQKASVQGNQSPADQITEESQKWEEFKRFGIGFAIVPLFTQSVQSIAELH